jgi:hypothetical protein
MFKADGTGTTDSTLAFYSAINTGSLIYVPAGVYIVDKLLISKSVTIFGDGSATIIKQSPTAVAGTNSINIVGASGVTFKSLQIRGFSDAPIFEEHTHLVFTNNARNVLFQAVQFTGWKGDGVYLGSNSAGTTNQDVVVDSCLFDGVNKQNRNAVSSITVDGLTVKNCIFTRCSRNDMPGAIDIEPNLVTDINKNITIRNNTLLDIGGNVGAITVFYKNAAFTQEPSNITIKDNILSNCQVALNYYDARGANASIVGYTYTAANNNVSDSVKGITVIGGSGVAVTGNNISNCTDSNFIGFSNTSTVYNVLFTGNKLQTNGSISGKGLVIASVDTLTISNNELSDCGTGNAGSSIAIDLGSNGTSSDISLINNTFTSPTGKTKVAVQKETSHVTNSATNRKIGNSFNGLIDNFPADITT